MTLLRRKTAHPEEQLQMSIVEYVRRCCPSVMIFSSLNGVYFGNSGKGSIYMAKMKKMGLTPGEPDLRLHWLGFDAPKTLYLECKIRPNKPTPAQEECMRKLKAAGFPSEVVYSLDEAIAAMRSWGVPTLERAVKVRI